MNLCQVEGRVLAIQDNKNSIFLQRKGQVFLQLILKDLSSLSLGFISCDAGPRVCNIHSDPSAFPPWSSEYIPLGALLTHFSQNIQGLAILLQIKELSYWRKGSCLTFCQGSSLHLLSSTPSFSYSAPTTLSSLFLKCTSLSPTSAFEISFPVLDYSSFKYSNSSFLHACLS